MNRKVKFIKRNRPLKNNAAAVMPVSLPTPQQERKFDIAITILLLLLGTFISINYYGFQVMPTSDVPAFLGTGQSVLSLQMPRDLKRGPVLGVLQVLLSRVVGGQSPELTAGYLLNAMVFPVIVVLTWLLGKKIVGKSAVWLAVIVAVNPWMIKMLQDPIAETLLLFFILLTYYFISKRSPWAYVLASTASMLRYECAALIVAALVIDIIEHKDRRNRIKACAYAALAGLPLTFWMAQTVLHWNSQESTHYLKVFTPEYAKMFKDTPVEDRVGLLKHLNMLWMVGFGSLLSPPLDASRSVSEFLEGLSKITILLTFSFGAVLGLIKKNWNILAFLIFLVPYVVVHSQYPYLIPRFYHTAFWFVTIVAFYGFKEIANLIRTGSGMPVWIVNGIRGLVLLVAVVWICVLAPWLRDADAVSRKSAVIPIAAAICIGAVVVIHIWLYRGRTLLKVFVPAVLVILVVLSNQFTLAAVVRDGQREAEFKELASWYLKNAKPPDKMTLYMAHMVRLFMPPESRQYMPGFPIAKDKAEFLQKCRQQNIRYVVWASREGYNPKSEYYQMNRLDNIDQLQERRDTDDFKYITTVSSPYGYVNIFYLKNGIPQTNK